MPEKKKQQQQKKAWILTVNMGYGHMRAAYPLKDIAHKRIITVNDDILVPKEEKESWKKTREFYEKISRLNDIPLVGKVTFGLYDNLQRISPFFPFEDRTKPNIYVKALKKHILKNKLCKKVIDEIKKTDLPVITTHFIPSLACEYYGIKNKIYTMVTDSDLNRVWIRDRPKDSKVIYLSPCRHASMRLRQYGIKESNLHLTGFPLPKENIGKTQNIVRKDIAKRIPNLDSKGDYIKKNHLHIKEVLKTKKIPEKTKKPLTITYLVGGAGAQKDIAIKMAKSLKDDIREEKISLNLVAGTNKKIKDYFIKSMMALNLEDNLKHNIKIIHENNKEHYFDKMSEILHDTDIIWSKPSEISFYAGLGIPIIMGPPLGAHETFNKEWLEHNGAGILQGKPEYTKEWLYYWLENKRFVKAAIDGFNEAPTRGTYKIEELINKSS